MLAILTTHPIQYQTPIWKALKADGRVPFEVWYLTRHGVKPSYDNEFDKTFSWDIDILSDYPYCFLETMPAATPTTPMRCRLRERLRDRLHRSGVTALWIQGWQVAAYWQAVREAKAKGIEVWLRGESNDLAPSNTWKSTLKRLPLRWLFERTDRFLYIGEANKRLYRNYGVPESKLYWAPYAVDNDRFAAQAEMIRAERLRLRRAWGIADGAFCVLFCGKLIAKKRPMDVVHAARALNRDHGKPIIHLLFCGAGELAADLRAACNVVFDAEAMDTNFAVLPNLPPATFAGFLNQTEISRAYVAADCLVLPSDAGETWGLVVNEALASGLPCVVSRACGCAADLVSSDLTFPVGDIMALTDRLAQLHANKLRLAPPILPSFQKTVEAVQSAYYALQVPDK
jgi:glycosyltransferase involved in cell wall biosynthesis